MGTRLRRILGAAVLSLAPAACAPQPVAVDGRPVATAAVGAAAGPSGVAWGVLAVFGCALVVLRRSTRTP